jgi:preprotein translocase subunit SecF
MWLDDETKGKTLHKLTHTEKWEHSHTTIKNLQTGLKRLLLLIGIISLLNGKIEQISMDIVKIETFYRKYYKPLMLIPLVVIIITLGILVNSYLKTGDIIDKDVSLKGGLTVTINTEVSNLKIEKAIEESFKEREFLVRKLAEFGSDKQIGVIIETTDIQEDELKSVLEKGVGLKLTRDNYFVEEVGSALGNEFYRQMIKALIFSFILMGIVVALFYRKLIPCIAVMQAAFSDIAVTLAVLNLIDYKLSAAGIGALLLLIGYSVDSDMVLATNVLKRHNENVFSGFVRSFKTGITMTMTTLAAVLIGFFFSLSPVLKEIFLIMFIGLIVDLLFTSLINAGLMMWYLERKHVN